MQPPGGQADIRLTETGRGSTVANRGDCRTGWRGRVPASRRARWTDQRGASLVEFSITITMLLTIVFGIITYGVLLSFKAGMTQAAAQGARAAAVEDWQDAEDVAEDATADAL